MGASAWTPVPSDVAAWTPVPSERPEPKGFASSFADSSGLSAIAHPIDTIMGLPSALKGMVSNTVDNVKQGVSDLKKEGLSEKARRDFGRAVPIVGPALAEAQAQHDAGNDAGMAGTMAGTVAGLVGPKALKEVAPMVPGVAGRAAIATGETMQDAGTGLVNKTVGTLKADFKRGANPARGYLATGNGPALSMSSLAEKADNAVDMTATKLSAAYKTADASGKIIPAKEVADAIAGPMREAYDVATGVGAPKGLLEDLKHHASTFRNVLEDGTEKGGFTPSQVWKIKKDLAKATSWSDPTQVGLKSVTQQQVGALSGVLQDAVPETTALNQNFMDLLKLSGRAEERANTGSRPLTAHIYKAGATAVGALAGGMEGNALIGAAVGSLLDTVPAKTTLATGLYRGGKLLSSLGERLTPADRAAVEGVTPNDLGGNGANYKPGYPQLTPPGPPELAANQNSNMRGLPPGYSPQSLPVSTAGFAPTAASPPPPLNAATARMRVQPNAPATPDAIPSRGPITVSPSGEAALTAKGLPSPTDTPTAKPLSGKALWAQRGTQNLAAHGVSASDLDALSKTAKGKDLLVIASGLTPGSVAMKNLIRQVKTLAAK